MHIYMDSMGTILNISLYQKGCKLKYGMIIYIIIYIYMFVCFYMFTNHLVAPRLIRFFGFWVGGDLIYAALLSRRLKTWKRGFSTCTMIASFFGDRRHLLRSFPSKMAQDPPK